MGTLAVDRWAVIFCTARRGLGGAAARPDLLAVPHHPATASVPITVLLYKYSLLCDINVPVKGLTSVSVYGP